MFGKKKREQEETVRQATVKVIRTEKDFWLARALTAPTDKEVHRAIRNYNIASRLLEKLSRKR